MRRTFHTDFNTITWVVSAYFLAQAAVIPVTGYLSDRIGNKAIYLGAMAVFVVASALCTLAPSKEFLIAARVLQGIGGGALFPTSFAIAYRAFPRDEWGRATSIIGVPVLLAPSLGPIIGGYLTTTFDWRTIFLINLPIGLPAIGLAAILLHARDGDTRSGDAAFDVAGLLLSILGFTAVVYGLTQAGIRGWSDATVLRALALGVILLAVLVVVEMRQRNPVLDVRIFRHATFSRSLLLLWIVTGFYYGSLFLIPFFFEKVQGLSAVTAGEIMVSQGIAAAVGIALGGELYSRTGPRLLVTAGAVSLALSTVGFTRLGVHSTGLSLQVWLVLRGFGLGLCSTPLQNLALSVVDRRDLARGSSLVNVTRQVFTAAGVAALAAYVAQSATHHATVLTASIHTAHPAPAAAGCALSGGDVANCIRAQAVTTGINDAFLIGLVICCLAVVVALVVGRDPSLDALKGTATDRIAETFPFLGRDQLVEVASRAQRLHLGAGEAIVRQGDNADRFYIITSGEVQVSRRTEAGGEVGLTVLRPGQYFGEIGLLRNVPRTATVTARTEVQLLALNEATFTDLTTRSQGVARELRETMEARVAILP